MTKSALGQMVRFHDSLSEVFIRHDMNLSQTSGRRNVVMSQAQEKFFADELSKRFVDVYEDGRTGQPDIVIGEIEKELECKITSGFGQYRNFDLQTDYTALQNKKKLDYLYILTDEKFEKFAVLHFICLTTDDFFPPASGARGKARMKKERAIKRCHILWGGVVCRNDSMADNINQKIVKAVSSMEDRVLDISSRIAMCSDRAVKKRENLVAMLDRETDRYQKKIKKLVDKRIFWKETPSQFTFILEPLS